MSAALSGIGASLRWPQPGASLSQRKFTGLGRQPLSLVGLLTNLIKPSSGKAVWLQIPMEESVHPMQPLDAWELTLVAWVGFPRIFQVFRQGHQFSRAFHVSPYFPFLVLSKLTIWDSLK